MTPAAPATPVFPEGRYGRRRDPGHLRRRRWLMYVFAALVLAGGLTIAFKLYRQYSNPLYEVTIIDVTELSDSGVTVTFDVVTPPGGGATCTIQAHTREGEQVARTEIQVPPGGPGQTTTRVTYTLTTTKRPVTGEVPGCGP